MEENVEGKVVRSATDVGQCSEKKIHRTRSRGEGGGSNPTVPIVGTAVNRLKYVCTNNIPLIVQLSGF